MLPPGFWDKVQVSTDTDCWLWKASRCQGYGHVRCNGLVKKAHRLSYEHFCGPIPDGLVVMHSCDNRACVNPDHLSVGTSYDNNLDRDLKGRHISLKGVDHGNAKLTQQQAHELAAYRSKISSDVDSFAQKYGVAKTTIRDVLSGKTWAHIVI